MSHILRRLIQPMLLLSLVPAAIAPLRADDLRTWSDATSKFKVRAKFDSLKDGKAVLIRENGAKLEIALDKLSQADRDYIAKQGSENPFQAVDENPFETAPIVEKKLADTPRVVSVDWSNSQVVPTLTSDTEWHVTVPDLPPADFHPRSVPLPPKGDFFANLQGVAINLKAQAAVVGVGLERHGRGEDQTNIVVCDLKTGRAVANVTTQTDTVMAPLALHDDGRQVLMRKDEFGFGRKNRLELWTISGKNAVPSLVWTPYGEEEVSQNDVAWAEFIDAKTLATCSLGGKLAIWELPAAQPVCYLQLCSDSVPALSPDRKWIAFACDDNIGLFDVEKHEVIASQKTPCRLNRPAVAFSPSGKKIACVAEDRIFVWDTASGHLEKDASFASQRIGNDICFPNENYVLVGNQTLIELEHQLKLWQYLNAEHVCTRGGTTFFAAIEEKGSGMLLAAKVPHSEAIALLKKALQQPDLFVFHKGTPVKLDVSGIPDDHKKQVSDALSKKLSDLKCAIRESAGVSVVALVEGPKSRQVDYMHSGSYQVQEYLTKLKFVHDGKTLWETSWTNVPGFVHVTADENLGTVLQKASEQPTYDFFDKVTLPEFLQKSSADAKHGQQPAPGSQTIGAAAVTPQGLR
jgi:WD40 repeat protein